jgi:hypothetical protein
MYFQWPNPLPPCAKFVTLWLHTLHCTRQACVVAFFLEFTIFVVYDILSVRFLHVASIHSA